MNLIVLSGNSPVNQLWLDAIEKYFSGMFDEIHKIIYSHWQNNDQMIDLSHESNKLLEITKIGKKNVIIAKSAGALVVLKMIKENNPVIDKCVLVGIPIHWANQNSFDLSGWLLNYSHPTLFIQQDDDPFGKCDELENQLLDFHVKNYVLQKVPGDDHSYTDFSDLKNRISHFLAS